MKKKISILLLTGAMLVNNIVPIFAMDNILTLPSVKIDNEEVADKIIKGEAVDLSESNSDANVKANLSGEGLLEDNEAKRSKKEDSKTSKESFKTELGKRGDESSDNTKGLNNKDSANKKSENNIIKSDSKSSRDTKVNSGFNKELGLNKDPGLRKDISKKQKNSVIEAGTKSSTDNTASKEVRKNSPAVLEERKTVKDSVVKGSEVKDSNVKDSSNGKETDDTNINGNLHNKDKEEEAKSIEDTESKITDKEKDTGLVKVEDSILEYENKNEQKLQEFSPGKQVDIFNENMEDKLDDISKDILEPLMASEFIPKMKVQPLMAINKSAGGTRFEDSAWDYDDFEFDGNTLLGFSNEGKKKKRNNHDLVLPGITDRRLPVTEIKDWAFYESKIETVDFSNCESLITIGEYAFCENKIENIDFSGCEKLTTIGDRAFKENQINSVDFSGYESLTTIGEWAFMKNQVESVDFTNCTSLTTIEKWAFCENQIKSVNFSGCESLITIGEYAFCENKIENVDFSGCEKLTTIGDSAFKENQIKSVNFSGCVNLHTIKGWTFYENQVESVDFTNCTSLTTIEKWAFCENKIENVDFSGCEKLTTIGYKTFYKNQIKSVNFSDCESLTTIGEEAFKFNNIKNIDLSLCFNLETIKDKAFKVNKFTEPIKLNDKIDIKNLNTVFGYNFLDYPAIPTWEQYLDEEFYKNNKSYPIIIFTPDKNTPYKDSILLDDKDRKSARVNPWIEFVVDIENENKSINDIEFELLINDSVAGTAVIENGKAVFDKILIDNIKNKYEIREKGTNNIIHTAYADEIIFEEKIIIDYKCSSWNCADFTFEENTITGFSEKGKEKVKNNKDLILPGYTDERKPVYAIGKTAFGRNWNIGNEYNLESVDFSGCKELRDIHSSAFENNNIKSIDLSSCKNLQRIGRATFRNNLITEINLKDCTKLDKIDYWAFENNKISKPVLLNNSSNIKFNEVFGYNLLDYKDKISCDNMFEEEFEKQIKAYPVILLTDNKDTKPEDSILYNRHNEKSARIDPRVTFNINIDDGLLEKVKDKKIELIANGATIDTVIAKNKKIVFDKVLVDNIENKYELKIENLNRTIYLTIAEEIIFKEKVDIDCELLPKFSDTWTYNDFIFDGNTLRGFSSQGSRKVATNKNLVLPGVTDKGLAIKGIKEGAFESKQIENVDFSNCNKLEKIEKDAFFDNRIQSLDFSHCSSLRFIGWSAFEVNRIQSINFTNCKSLESIDEQAFNMNLLTELDLTPCISLKKIGNLAFTFNKFSKLIKVNDNINISTLTTAFGYNYLGSSYNDTKKNFGQMIHYPNRYSRDCTPVIIQQKNNTSFCNFILPTFPFIFSKGSPKAISTNDVIPEAIRVNPYVQFIINGNDKSKPINEARFELLINNKTVNTVISKNNKTVFDKILIDNIKNKYEIKNVNTGEIIYTAVADEIVFKEKININVTEKVELPKFNDTWTYSDFIFTDNTLKGFSEQGKEKIEYNKDLVLPGITDKGFAVERIAKDAFKEKNIATVDFSNCTSLTIIDFDAFEKNKIKTVDFSKCESLRIIGGGAFTENNIRKLDLSPCVNLQTIGTWAFGKNNIEKVNFTDCENLITIGYAAFTENNIRKLDLSPCVNLGTIAGSAFADNKIETVDFSGCRSLITIYSQAFIFNNIKSLDLSQCDELSTIERWTFETNKFTEPIRLNNKIDVKTLNDVFGYNFLDYPGVPKAGQFNNEEFYKNNKSYPIIVFTPDKNTPYKDSILLDSSSRKSARVDPWVEFSVNIVEKKTKKPIDNINLELLVNGKTADTAVSKGEKAVFDKVLIDNIRNKYEVRDTNTGEIIYSALADEVIYDEKINIDCETDNNSSVWAVEDFEFRDNTLIGFSEQGKEKIKTNKNLVLPGVTDKDLPIKKIEYWAFMQCQIKSVDFSACSALEEIGGYAFARNKGMKSVDFTNCSKLTTIGYSAFERNNIQSLDLSPCSALTKIGNKAFRENQIKSVDFTNCSKLTTIGYSAFKRNNIQSLDLSPCSALIEINDSAFAENKGIKSVDFTNCSKLTTIGGSVFKGNNIQSLDLSPCSALMEIGNDAFVNNKINKFIILNNKLNKNDLKGSFGYNFLDYSETITEEQFNSSNFYAKNKSYPIIAMTPSKDTAFKDSIVLDNRNRKTMRIDPLVNFNINVKDENKNPIKNEEIKINFNGRNKTVTTNNEGKAQFNKYLIDKIEEDIKIEIANTPTGYQKFKPLILNSTDILFKENVDIDLKYQLTPYTVKISNVDIRNKPIAGSEFVLYKNGEEFEKIKTEKDGVALFENIMLEDLDNDILSVKQLFSPGNFGILEKEYVLNFDKMIDNTLKLSVVNGYISTYYLPETGTLGIVPYVIISLFVISAGVYISKKKRKYN